MDAPRTLSGWVTRTGLVGTDDGGRLVSVRAVLRVTRGPDVGRTLELDAGSAFVGTHRTCDLALTDRTVSRRHAELLLLSGGARVRDLGSKNGTFVGGTRVEDATVPLPFELRVGSTHVEVRSADLPLPDVAAERTAFGSLVGQSASMRRAFGVLERVAATDVPILFSGEPGTGKTAACAAVHQASGRRGPLFFLDPTRTIDRDVVDAALSASAGGTLILERIDEWPRHASEALMAALDAAQGEARIVATSSADLRAAVEEGRFPRALWFFVASVHVALPPLRDRIEDVPLLVAAFLRELGHEGSAPPAEIAQKVGRGLPGNVRELRSLVESALAHAAAPRRDEPASAPPEGYADLPYHEAKAQLLDAFERRYLIDLMGRHDGVVLHAADEAGLGRNHLARLLKKHGLK